MVWFNTFLLLPKSSLYSGVLFAAVFGILLPFSTVSYFNFYEKLIPQNIHQIPLTMSYSDNDRYDTITVNSIRFSDVINEKTELDYDIVLNLEISCLRHKGRERARLDLKLDDTPLAYIEKTINCDSRSIHASRNNFVPYNLKYWVPPILVNEEDSIHIFEKLHIHKSIRELTYQNSSLTLSFMSQWVSFEVGKSFVELHVQWEGFRYFLTKHSWISFILGVSLFWTISSITCITTALLILATYSK